MGSIFYTYEEAIEYIENLPKFTEKHTLSHTRNYLIELGIQEDKFKIIHIAGTNGKGSVSAMLSNILVLQNIRTGLFVSPHLIKHNERIKMDNKDIDDNEFLDAFIKVKNKIDEKEREGISHPSYFEFLFLMAMYYFNEKNAEYIILETGLGGRLDATNCLTKKELAIITQVGLDHMEYLGNTVKEIAGEKAGIIRENTPVIFQATDAKVTDVIEKMAAKVNAMAYPVARDYYKINIKRDKSIDFSINSGYYFKCEFTVPFTSEYQVMNAAVVLEAVSKLKINHDYELIRQAIMTVKWEGRMEFAAPGVILDGAHNGPGIDEFIKTFNDYRCVGRKNILFSVVKDKDYDYMISVISRTDARKVYITQLDSSRALSTDKILRDFRDNNCHAEIAIVDNVSDAYDLAVNEKNKDDILFCVGSLYLVGEIKKHILSL